MRQPPAGNDIEAIRRKFHCRDVKSLLPHAVDIDYVVDRNNLISIFRTICAQFFRQCRRNRNYLVCLSVSVCIVILPPHCAVMIKHQKPIRRDGTDSRFGSAIAVYNRRIKMFAFELLFHVQRIASCLRGAKNDAKREPYETAEFRCILRFLHDIVQALAAVPLWERHFVLSVGNYQAALRRYSVRNVQAVPQNKTGHVKSVVIKAIKQIHQCRFNPADPQGFGYKNQLLFHFSNPLLFGKMLSNALRSRKAKLSKSTAFSGSFMQSIS